MQGSNCSGSAQTANPGQDTQNPPAQGTQCQGGKCEGKKEEAAS